MTHPTPEELLSFKRRTLASRELLAVDDHIADCEECRRSLAEGVTVGTALQRALDAVRGEHLPYEAIEQYVRGELPSDEREALAAHVEMCPVCAREIDDLERYVRKEGRPSWNWWMAAAAAVVVLIAIAMFQMRDTRDPQYVHRGPGIRKPSVTETGPRPAPTDSAVATLPDPLNALTPSLRRVAEALEAGTLSSAALLASLQPPGEHERSGDPGGDAGIDLLDPVGSVVETDRPTFRWDRGGRSEEFTVQVYDRSYGVVVESPRFRGTSWTAPAALERGATYRWQLRVHFADGRSVTVPAPPTPPALFHVVGRKAFEELRTARQSGSSLQAGLICIREGLLTEGAQLLSRYAADNPRSAHAARLAERATVIATSQRARTVTSSKDD